MIPWYYAAIIALSTFTLGAWAGYRRGYVVATLKALGQTLDVLGRIKP